MILLSLYCVFTMLFTLGKLISTEPPEDANWLEVALGAALAIIIAPIMVPIMLGRDY